ncbi:hypothetical protein MHU86_5391 [Fragilaria crotonensis]|nr:hypothetical protein MHU86_5391 [Fragilaria crotonensis]
MARIKRNRCTTNPGGTAFVVLILCMICATGRALLIPQRVVPSMPVSTVRRVFPNLWEQQKEETNVGAIPFIIDRLGDRPADHVFDEVAGMCIDVFFNKSRTNPPPWTRVQLKYLSSIQAADLRRRKLNTNDDASPVAMFVARRVIPMKSPEVAQTTPLILDLDRIENLDIDLNTRGTIDYVRGDVVGFCEVSERPYGLGDVPGATRGKRQASNGRPNPRRPFLTNLSVTSEARNSGIGSQLMEACEAAVESWGGEEVILEVEADNNRALEFYQKRGYNICDSTKKVGLGNVDQVSHGGLIETFPVVSRKCL